MRATVEEVNLTKIRRGDAFELRNELLKISDGNLQMYPDKYPKLNELFELLSGLFEHQKSGVHFIQNKEKG